MRDRGISPAIKEGSPYDIESSTTSQTSGVDLSSLEAKMQEIEDSIQEMNLSEDASTPTPAVEPAQEEEEEEDSDSEDEDEGGKFGDGDRKDDVGHFVF